jgi:hypothetical protein
MIVISVLAGILLDSVSIMSDRFLIAIYCRSGS